MNNVHNPWIVFEIKNELFSISSQNVVAIIKEPKITSIPGSQKNAKGIFCYRDETFKLLDLRTMLNISKIEEECQSFFDLMDARYQDHTNWLKELRNSVDERREFTLATNPHKCAFGKWYDKYREQELQLRVLMVLDKFDDPHKQIHEIATKVEKFKKNNDFEKAHKLIEQTQENELSAMLKLFEEMKKAYKDSLKQSVIVLKNETQKSAIAVDSVISVETLEDINTENIDERILDLHKLSFISGLAKNSDKDTVIRLNEKEFLHMG